MRQPHSYNYDTEWTLESIKVEPQLENESAFCYHSSPTTSSSQSVYNSSGPSSYPRRPASPIALQNRHSHPNLHRIDPTFGTELDMSHHYRQYSASPPSAGSSRRSGSGEEHAAAFGYPDSYSQGMRHTPANSAMTSSLSGAVGPMTTSPSGMAWTPQNSLPEGFNIDTEALFGTPPTPLSAESNSSYLSYGTYNAPGFPTSPDSQMAPSYPMSYQTLRPPVVVPSQSSSSHGVPMIMSPAPSGVSPQNELEVLREQVQRLSAENNKLRHALRSQAPHGLPSPAPTPTFQQSSQAFQQSWNARTGARTKLLCSLNRAGNALCAWHDSRRERRQYPPRNAPPGYLNCGCTYEEALFEESLSRHEVGSYHPGESVRMDPALRNPLLKLLKARYGYRDGDFERDPKTGDWIEGEGPARWEAKYQAGLTPKKSREDRH
ncbi:hypothetical protein QCA50_013827 [Cerrena zonata]|uniref:Uncharacterized protein n=1 Tax=Cerrena zonata TaxID=2478898 RepID=A0AAW0FY87_9APHY